MIEASSAYVVSTTTRVPGYSAVMRVVAVTPSQPGMFRSMSTTCGRVAATRSTAALPSAACPATVMPGRVPSSRTRPSRTADWSSATTTVTGSPGVPESVMR
jgi:hypothetical protein